MAYEMVMPYHLHMPSYFLETFTEYPYKKKKKGDFYSSRRNPGPHPGASFLRIFFLQLPFHFSYFFFLVFSVLLKNCLQIYIFFSKKEPKTG